MEQKSEKTDIYPETAVLYGDVTISRVMKIYNIITVNLCHRCIELLKWFIISDRQEPTYFLYIASQSTFFRHYY
jgi:hypothetical protein